MSHPAIMEITPCWKWEWQDMAQNKDQTSKASLEGEGLKVIEWDVTVPALKMKWNTRKTLPQELIKVWRNGSKEDPLKEMAFKQEKIQNFSLESKHLRWNVVSFPKVLYTVKLTAFRSGEQQKKVWANLWNSNSLPLCIQQFSSHCRGITCLPSCIIQENSEAMSKEPLFTWHTPQKIKA